MEIKELCKHFLRILPDRIYFNFKYFKTFGKFIDFSDPKTYNEKLQWLKLYDRNPFYQILVDKYRVKDYVSKEIGEDHVIKLLGVWNSFDEIDFDRLPDQFVLKCNHDSGGIVICKDKSKFDKASAKKLLESHLKDNHYWYHREWPYKDVKPVIFAEEFMVDDTGYELRDYKWFCFNGEPKLLFVAQDRNRPDEELKFDFYDMDFNHLDLRNGHPNANALTERPAGFDQMVKLARKLSQGIPHVRVDFYDINGKIYFGEMTLYHNAGFVNFEPLEWNRIIGDWIILPPKQTSSGRELSIHENPLHP